MNRIIQPGTTITVSIYGRPRLVTVLRVHPAGTIDVQCVDGRCFRVSGLRA